MPERLPPQFVVVSLFANDFAGDLKVVLDGRGGDWDEGKYWLGRIREFCFARGIPCVFVPAPWVNQLVRAADRRELSGPISNILEATGIHYLDPIDEFADATARASRSKAPRRGEPVTGDPLFNGRIGDGHFSPRGCEVWAERVGRRVAAPNQADRAVRERPPRLTG